MARFALGRDEDGDGEGSDDVPLSFSRKRARLVSVPRQQPPPRLLIRPEPPVVPVAHEEESEESEQDDESNSDPEEDEESEEEEEEEEEELAEEEDNDVDDGEEEEVRSSDDDDDDVAILATHSARPSGAAHANPPQAGSASTSHAPTSARAPEALRSISPVKDGPLVFTLADPDVLDCLICYEPLTVPVFQCENGHIACCSCCIKSKNKCPSCTWPIGYNRCRAIEKVLESIRVACQNAKHGCRGLVAYNKKNEHEKACIHSPCSCPHSGCSFISSCKQLYLHFSSSHANTAIRFVYNKTFSITLKIEEKFLVLRDQIDGVLFILANERKTLGNCVSLQCIQPTFLGDFHYDILAKTKGSSQRFQSSAKNTPSRIDNPSTGYFILPSDFFRSSQLKIDLCIWRGPCPAPLQLINVA